MSDLTDENDPDFPLPSLGASTYTDRFLTFVHGIPFRIAALRQELAEIYAYEGRLDEEMRERVRHMMPAERESFLVAARELSRLEAMQARFEIVEAQGGDREEQFSAFLLEHETALEAWHELPPAGSIHGEDLPPPIVRARPVSEEALHRAGEENLHPRESLFRAQGSGMGSVRASIQNAGGELGEIAGDDFTDHVLNALADAELQEAERRFGQRLRWLSSLPPRQRMAVTLRAAGLRRRDVALRMEISEESVKTHLQRADEEWSRWRAKPGG